MYTHEIPSLDSRPPITMRHLRESTSPSGLITLQEIGHTVAFFHPPTQRTSASGLLLPNVHDSFMVHAGRNDETKRTIEQDHIQSATLEEFVISGIEHWKELFKTLGATATLDVHLAENRKPAEEITESGLIVASDITETPLTEFTSFVATPAEINAMHRIAGFVYDTDPGAGRPGNYL